MQRKMLAVALAVATAAAGTLIPAGAHAAQPPSIVHAGSVNGDLGTLEVFATAQAGIASIQARIVHPDTGEQVASTTDFVLHSGTVQDGSWRTPQPLQIAELGSYWLALEVTDAEGQQVSNPEAGTVSYVVETWIEDLVVPSTVTYATRVAPVTGRLLGRWPADRAVRGVGDFPIQVMGTAGWTPVETRTNADGTFQTALAIEGQDEMVMVQSISDDPGYWNAYQGAFTTIEPVPTRVSANLDRRHVIAGEQIHITGQVKWQSPDGWRNYPGLYVGVLHCFDEQCQNSSSIGYPELDDQGRFSITYTPYLTGWVKVGHGGDDPWVNTTFSELKPVRVTQRAEFTTFAATRENPGQVRVTGHLAFRSGFTPGVMPIEIQFSRTGTGNWRTLRTVDIGHNPTHPEGYFFSELADQNRSGFWRVVYHGGEMFQTDRTDPIEVL